MKQSKAKYPEVAINGGRGGKRPRNKAPYSSVSNRSGEAIEWGANRRGCSCRLVFNKKRVLIEGGMHVGSFSIEK